MKKTTTKGVVKGAVLRDARTALRMSQTDFGARFLGCPQSAVSERESGLTMVTLAEAWAIWCALTTATSAKNSPVSVMLAKDLLSRIESWIKRAYKEKAAAAAGK